MFLFGSSSSFTSCKVRLIKSSSSIMWTLLVDGPSAAPKWVLIAIRNVPTMTTKRSFGLGAGMRVNLVGAIKWCVLVIPSTSPRWRGREREREKRGVRCRKTNWNDRHVRSSAVARMANMPHTSYIFLLLRTHNVDESCYIFLLGVKRARGGKKMVRQLPIILHVHLSEWERRYTLCVYKVW